MKPLTIALAISGGVFLVTGFFVSYITPVRSVSKTNRQATGGDLVTTSHVNVWGKALRFSQHLTYNSPEQKPHGDGIGNIPDEYIEEGDVDWGNAKHGPWVTRRRYGTEWQEETFWYIHGITTSRDVWEGRK